MSTRKRLIIPLIAFLLLMAGCSGQSPEMRQAQEELDAACSQIDIQELQEMGMDPAEYGCEEDGTGIPVEEWIEQNE